MGKVHRAAEEIQVMQKDLPILMDGGGRSEELVGICPQ